MKKATLLLLALTAATPALAQQAPDHHDRDHQDGDRHDHGGDHDRQPGGHDARHAPGPDHAGAPDRSPDNRLQARPYLRPNGGGADIARRPGPGGGWEGRDHGARPGAQPGGWDHRDGGRFDGDHRREEWQTPRQPGWRPGDRGPAGRAPGAWDRGDHRPGGWDRGDHRPGGWDRNWRGDPRYDWQRYRSYNRERFRGPRYFAPRGYGYRQWYPGLRIEPFLYGRNYWIQDFSDYRLPPPPPGAQWVRYYNDIALIDVYNGTVLDVIQGFFY